MRNASEVLEMTRKESRLARACDKLVEMCTDGVESAASAGHRKFRVELEKIKEFGIGTWEFSHEEIADMMDYKFTEKGYKVQHSLTKFHIDIMW